MELPVLSLVTLLGPVVREGYFKPKVGGCNGGRSGLAGEKLLVSKVQALRSKASCFWRWPWNLTPPQTPPPPSPALAGPCPPSSLTCTPSLVSSFC